MPNAQGIDQALLDKVLGEAKKSLRLRKNFNFHDRTTDPCQRLLNAILPGAYIQPHRHLDPNKAEMLIILRGRLGIVIFDEAGNVVDKVLLEEGGTRLGIHIPPGVFHTAVAFGAGAVVFEAKAGPYAPHAPGETASFAPAEDAPGAVEYRQRLECLFDPML